MRSWKNVPEKKVRARIINSVKSLYNRSSYRIVYTGSNVLFTFHRLANATLGTGTGKRPSWTEMVTLQRETALNMYIVRHPAPTPSINVTLPYSDEQRKKTERYFFTMFFTVSKLCAKLKVLKFGYFKIKKARRIVFQNHTHLPHLFRFQAYKSFGRC